MEAKERDAVPTLALLQRLAADGIPRTSFFTAVRLLERVVQSEVRIGGEGPYAREGVNFRHQHSMFSQPNELSKIRGVPRWDRGVMVTPERWRYELTTCFLGLTGTDSPLPLYLVSEFAQDDDPAGLQREFLDLFHNRLTALFYRAVTKYHFPSELRSDGSDRTSGRALQLAGFDVQTHLSHGVTHLQLLHVASLFAAGPATPRSLQNSLRALLRRELEAAKLSVHEFTGGWVPLDPEQHNSLGKANNESAVTFVIGTRVRHPAHEARVVIGPMTPMHARSFSPGGKVFRRIVALVDTLCPAPAIIKLELHVQTRAFPPFILGRRKIARDACISARRDRDGAITVRVFDLPRPNALQEDDRRAS